MKSLFNSGHSQELIGRISRLTPEANPLWGKMNASQMLAHAQIPFKVALKEVVIKRGLVGILFGGIAKKQLVKDEPFKKNLPTDKNFIIRHQPDFETEKQKLLVMVQRFGQTGETAISKDPHPFFGKLSIPEWDALMWKHLDHHLRQFGA